jgi:hypothetical protein
MGKLGKLSRRKTMLLVLLWVFLLIVVGAGCGAGRPGADTQSTVAAEQSVVGGQVPRKSGSATTIRRTVMKTRPSGPGSTKAVPWQVKPRKGSKYLALLLSYSSCRFRHVPQPQRIEIVERKAKAVVTAFVFFPAAAATSPYQACPQTRFLVSTRILLPEASRRVLYDGSTTPASQRWP